MADQQERHVFISYVGENKKQVDRLCQDLKHHGVNVWRDRDNITPGLFWEDAIRKAIREGAFFIACFSKEYNEKTSTHMNEELNLAIKVLRKRPREQAWFIPAVLSGDVPDWEIFPGKTLQSIQWVSLYENWDSGIERILSVIKPIPLEIQNLIIALRSENRDVRMGVVSTLGETGDPVAVPALIEALKDDDEVVRREATEALGKIGPEAKSAVPHLIETLKDDDEVVRREATGALGKIGPEAKSAVPHLIEALKKDKMLRFNVSIALFRIAPEAKVTVSAFIETFKNEDNDVRRYSKMFLEAIGPAAVPALIESLQDKDKKVRRQATVVLGNIGPEANATVPSLTKSLKDNDGNVRRYAASALKKINTPEAQKALEYYKKKSN